MDFALLFSNQAKKSVIKIIMIYPPIIIISFSIAMVPLFAFSAIGMAAQVVGLFADTLFAVFFIDL